MTSSSSRSADQHQEPQEQRYNRINNNHVIAGVGAGPVECPRGETVESVACGDECDAATATVIDVSISGGPCPSPAEVPTPTNDGGHESPGKTDVDTRIPVYV